MKIKKYISTIRGIADGLAKQNKLREMGYVIMISPKEYDEIFIKSGGDLSNPKQYLTIAKLLVIKHPTVAKRKYQVLPQKEYLSMWKKYEARAQALRKTLVAPAQVTPPQEVVAGGDGNEIKG